MDKTWFSAKLLFRADVEGDSGDGSLFEESVRILRGIDEADVQRAANLLGKKEEHDYKNDAGQIVRWRFIETLEVQDLCEEALADGSEVYSRMFRKED